MKAQPLHEEKVQYRLLTKSPTDHRFKYRGFTGARSDDKERILHWLEKHKNQSPDWQFKIQARTVVITRTPWKDSQ